MTPSHLDDLLNDGRLARLFSQDDRHCALQLWILQLKFDQAVENRVIYARLVPYNFSRNSWSGSDDDNFTAFGQDRVQILQLSLYVKSALCTALIRQLAAGETITKISDNLALGFSDNLKGRFGSTSLCTDKLVYRPVAFLLNRDGHELKRVSSPHGAAGAFSASVVQADKGTLFRLAQIYSVALAKFVVNKLNADTGLDFGGLDAVRFGDLELMVFPTLDDAEKDLLHVSWNADPLALVARFNPIQVPAYSGFQFRLVIANGDQVAFSSIGSADQDKDGAFICKFDIDEQLRARTDSTELEIYGFQDAETRQGMLCCRWRLFYVREIDLEGSAIGNGSGPVKFDWLEKTVRPSSSKRAKAALTPNRGDRGFQSRVGGRDADPWVPAYRNLQSLFERLHPPKSEGKFFMRWGQGDPEARLQFVEWFKALLGRYSQHQVVIFDPYFEDAGLGLLLLCATPKADYIVFRSLPRPRKEPSDAMEDAGESVRTGVNNLIASCELNRELLSQFNLRLYGMKNGRLHDRYILIMAPDSLPVVGFNLSNSFQTAAENYPLLITPIPQDALLEVERYKSELVQEASEAADEGDKNPAMRLLFDSSAVPRQSRRFEPLGFLKWTNAGDVLSVWSGDPSLKGLSDDPLRDRMAALGLIRDQSLTLPEAVKLRHFIDLQAGDFTNFTPTWEVLGELLAHSRDGSTRFEGVNSSPDFLMFLTHFLEGSFSRAHGVETKEIAVVDARFFRRELEGFLQGPYTPEHLFHPTKYAALSWSEYFSIKLLWWYAPEALVALGKAEMLKVPTDPQDADVMRLSLLSQIVSEISLSVQLKIDETQRDALNRSSNGTLRWLGLNALNRALETAGGFAASLQVVLAFAYSDKIRALGWMINSAARDTKKTQIYADLVKAMHEALPTPLAKKDLKQLIDAMRGHMRQISWAEPWLYRDVISPLVETGRVNPDFACEIWVQEVIGWLEGDQSNRGYFQLRHEGQTINVATYLTACSSVEQRVSSVKEMQRVLRRQQRILHQPLASTSNWTQWNNALMASMQILAFARWVQFYLQGRGLEDGGVNNLAKAAGGLALIRPLDEWRAMGGNGWSELATFLDKADELLASNAEGNGEPQG